MKMVQSVSKFLPRILKGFAFAIFMSAFSAFPEEQPQVLYPGISLRQHELAQETMHELFDLNWNKADSLGGEMRNIEQADNLPPLSFMLRFAVPAWRILNNEFDSHKQEDSLYKKLEPLRLECIRILHTGHFPDSTRPTRMFLEAGINGFNATLIIRSKPLMALKEGLQSYRTLDSLRTIAPQMKDLYLGMGLFQCALANEPSFIGFAIHLFGGLHVSLDSGLAYLRICSNEAYYTRQGAREYLIQFLSPFKANESNEKQLVFRMLEAEFPRNPYYVFQEIDENMAFHRQVAFSDDFRKWAIARVACLDTENSAVRPYSNCVRWQFSVMDSTLVPDFKPAPFAPQSCFSFYPDFLQAVKEKYLIETGGDLGERQKRSMVHADHKLRNKAFSILRKSDITVMLRDYYEWHMEDGLQ
jgi:hypothetical protein